MKKRELFHTIIVQYFICYTGTMFATLILCSLSQPNIQFPLSYLWKVALFSLCAGLPTFVYYSPTDLSRKQWWQRTVIHTLLIEIILMWAGHQIGMYQGTMGGVLFAGVILAVDLFVRLITFLSDWYTADEINEQLKKNGRRSELHE